MSKEKFLLLIIILIMVAGCTERNVSVSQIVNLNPSTQTATPLSPLPHQTPTSTASPATTTPTTSPSPLPTVTPSSTPAPIPTPTPQTTPTVVTPAPTRRVETGPAETACAIEHVVIISVDGLRPDAIDQADTPTLDVLRQAGTYTAQAQAVVPSVTLVNHASMLGGMTPAKHGIYWNTENTGLGKVHGPTLFSVAHEAGFSTGMVVGKPKLEDLVLPNSVDHYIYAGFTDGQVGAEALNLIETDMPDILFIHLPDVDSAGHAIGWMSGAQLLVLNFTDGVIGEIVETLQSNGYAENTLLIVTSDHGGSGTSHGSDSPEDMMIPWLAVGPGVPVDYLLERNLITYDTAATALYALNIPIPEVWDGQPVLEVVDKTDCS